MRKTRHIWTSIYILYVIFRKTLGVGKYYGKLRKRGFLRPTHDDNNMVQTSDNVWLRLMNIIQPRKDKNQLWSEEFRHLVHTPIHTCTIILIYNSRLFQLSLVLVLESLKRDHIAFRSRSAHTPLESKYCTPPHPSTAARRGGPPGSLSFVCVLLPPSDWISTPAVPNEGRLPSGVAESVVFGKHSCPKLKSVARARPLENVNNNKSMTKKRKKTRTKHGYFSGRDFGHLFFPLLFLSFYLFTFRSVGVYLPSEFPDNGYSERRRRCRASCFGMRSYYCPPDYTRRHDIFCFVCITKLRPNG